MVTFHTTQQIILAMTIVMRLAFLSILSSLLLLGGPVAGKPNGLTIKLIHRDSPASPLYPGNITFSERIRRLVKQSKARATNEAIRVPFGIQGMANAANAEIWHWHLQCNFPCKTIQVIPLAHGYRKCPHMDAVSGL
jgi:hypothetical protein